MSFKMSYQRWIAATGLIFFLGSCGEKPDLNRPDSERESVGEEVFNVFCLRFAAEEYPYSLDGQEPRALCDGSQEVTEETPPRTAALVSNRARLIAALDQTFPEEIHEELDEFLLKLVELYELPNEEVPVLMRTIADVLEHVANDPEATAAIARLINHNGYRPLNMALGTVRPILSYPELQNVFTVGLAAMSENGSFEQEWNQFLEILALEMATYDGLDTTIEAETTLEVAQEFFFSQDLQFSSGESRWTPLRDARGVVIPENENGTLPPEFLDANNDGLADLDPWQQFLGVDGEPLVLATPFTTIDHPDGERDENGLALRENGAPLWSYIDADQTVLATIIREVSVWFDPEEPTLQRLLVGIPAMFGDVIEQEVNYNAYSTQFDGYNYSNAAVIDVIHAFTPLLRAEYTSDMLTLVQILAQEHPEQLAQIASLVWFVVDHTAESNHRLVENSTLWDDLRDILVHVVEDEPGLLEDLLEAIIDPRTVRMGDISATLLRSQDVIDFNPADINGRPLGDFITPVDWNSPDTGTNLSNWQRMLRIINDLNNAEFCNKDGAVMHFDFLIPVRWPLIGDYDRCELTHVENMSLFFTQSIIGRAELEFGSDTVNFLIGVGDRTGISVDQLLEEQTEINGLTLNPTPQSLARLVFADWNEFLTDLYEDPRNIDGERAKIIDGGSIWAWEYWEWPENNPTDEMGFFEALEPILLAFDGDVEMYGSESVNRNRLDLFLDLLSVLHRHWPSPNADHAQNTDPNASFFAHSSNARSYESLLADLFANQPGVPTAEFSNAGQVFSITAQLLQTLESIEVRPGVTGLETLADFSEELLLPSRWSNLTTRDGRTLNCRNDGTCRAPNDDDLEDPMGRNVSFSPLTLLIDSLRSLDEALAQDPERREQWELARNVILTQLFTLNDENMSFENERILPFLSIFSHFLQDRIAQHETPEELEQWANNLVPRLQAWMELPLMVTLLNFLTAVETDPEARAVILDLVGYLMSEASENDAFDISLVAIFAMLQAMEDNNNFIPLFQSLSYAFAPNLEEALQSGEIPDLENGMVRQLLDVTQTINYLDSEQVFQQIMTNIVSINMPDQSTPLETILDVIGEVNRADPTTPNGVITDEDVQRVLLETQSFLTSDTRGLERLFDVVQNREQ